jgi:hypothetical protein
MVKVERKPQIFVALLPELVQAYGDLLPVFLREGIVQVIGMDWWELNKLPKDAVDEFYAVGRQYRRSVRVSPEIYVCWKAIPRSLKKRAQYWINQWLLEAARPVLESPEATGEG